MTRRGAVAGGFALAALLSGAIVWTARRDRPRSAPPAEEPILSRAGGDADALARLSLIPLYRALIDAKAVRAATLDGETVRVEVDLRALAEPRLTALGWAGASKLLPASARGAIEIVPGSGTQPASVRSESWLFPGPAPILDVLDRAALAATGPRVWDTVPGAPSAVVRVRLMPGKLADPALLGGALPAWRDRLDMVEKLLGRPIRAEIAGDLAGPGVFALYEGDRATEAEGLAAFELRRSDRVAGVLDTVFGLGALTERATVTRYRGVATGSFTPARGGPGLALGVDGGVLFIASSRSRLEAAIDARRAPARFDGLPFPGEPAGSWRAVSMSTFVARGWTKLARAGDASTRGIVTATATLAPEGEADWRLSGRGPAPAITADPIVPFLRSVFGGRQRDPG